MTDIRSKIESEIEKVLNEVLVDKVQEIIESEVRGFRYRGLCRYRKHGKR